MSLTASLGQNRIRTSLNIPRLCGSLDAGTQHAGSSNGFVGLNCNGVWELKHTAHGVSGYYDDYWYEVYEWYNQTSNFATRMFRKTSDNTWVMVQNNGTVRYTNPSKSLVPPKTGWVTTGGTGATPVPQITFNSIITEYSPLTLTNCTVVDNSQPDRISIMSQSSSGTKNIIFGTNTLSVGDKYAFGFKLVTSGIDNGRLGNLLLGGQVIMASYPIENVTESPSPREHSFDQVVGKKHDGSDYTPSSTGFTMQNYVDVFPDGAVMEIIDLRVFVL